MAQGQQGAAVAGGVTCPGKKSETDTPPVLLILVPTHTHTHTQTNTHPIKTKHSLQRSSHGDKHTGNFLSLRSKNGKWEQSWGISSFTGWAHVREPDGPLCYPLKPLPAPHPHPLHTHEYFSSNHWLTFWTASDNSFKALPARRALPQSRQEMTMVEELSGILMTWFFLCCIVQSGMTGRQCNTVVSCNLGWGLAGHFYLILWLIAGLAG